MELNKLKNNNGTYLYKDEGFNTIKITRDLENEPIFEENIETEHEQMFKRDGIKVKALIAKLINNNVTFHKKLVSKT